MGTTKMYQSNKSMAVVCQVASRAIKNGFYCMDLFC